jgi:sec-independent protein translocase protein TatC
MSKVNATPPAIPPTTDNYFPGDESVGPVMTIWDHIEELRSRLMKALLALALCMLVAAFVTTPAISFLAYGRKLYVTNPTDSVVIFFRVALLLGAILASPVITYQLFMFVIPGLTRQERKWIFLALPATTALFLLGIVFTWVYLVPLYVNFLSNFQGEILEEIWTADSYVGFVTAVLFWHAAAFETPLIFYVLARLGVVTAGAMLKYWRLAIIGAAVAAAVITPTVDPVTMSVITVILLVLYVTSIVLVWVAQRVNPANRRRRTR